MNWFLLGGSTFSFATFADHQQNIDSQCQWFYGDYGRTVTCGVNEVSAFKESTASIVSRLLQTDLRQFGNDPGTMLVLVPMIISRR